LNDRAVPTVALLPAASAGHPYLASLAAALREAGVGVETDLPFRLNDLLAARRRVDVLHFHWPAYYHLASRTPLAVAWYAAKLLLARALGYRIVWTVHNLLPHEGPRWAARLDRRVLVRVADAVICHCRAAEAELARSLGRTRGVWVIPHGPLRGVSGDGGTREAARAFLRVPEGTFLYLCVGEIRPYKGVEDLLAAYGDAPGTLLLVAGAVRDLGLLDRIRRQSEGRPSVRVFPRRLPEHRLAAMLRASDAVVLPYRRVTTSGLLHLALAHGARIVAPALGCIPEAVDDRCAVLYDPAQREGLARALAAVRELDPEAAGAAARERAAAVTWGGIAAATREVYLAANDPDEFS
jgi:beta-1,4-mannosyltransferase